MSNVLTMTGLPCTSRAPRPSSARETPTATLPDLPPLLLLLPRHRLPLLNRLALHRLPPERRLGPQQDPASGTASATLRCGASSQSLKHPRGTRRPFPPRRRMPSRRSPLVACL